MLLLLMSVSEFSCEGDGHSRNAKCQHNGKHTWSWGKGGANSQYIQGEFDVLMVRRSVLIGRDDGRSRGGARITVDDHREPMVDPMRRSDPHDWYRALDLDDPKFKLS